MGLDMPQNVFISGGNIYKFPLAESLYGKTVRISATQQGGDIRLEIRDQDHALITSEDSTTACVGDELLLVEVGSKPLFVILVFKDENELHGNARILATADSNHAGRAYRALLKARGTGGDAEARNAAFGSAAEAWRAIGDARLEALVYKYWSRSLARVGDASGRYQQMVRATNLYEKAGETEQFVLSLSRLGWAAHKGGMQFESDAAFNRAKALSDQYGLDGPRAILWDTWGAVLYARGKPHEALVLYQKARGIFNKRGNSYREAKVLENMGTAYSLIGDLTLARDMFEQSLALRKGGTSDKRALSLIELGWLHYRSKQLDIAVAYYEEALAVIGNKGASRYAAGVRDRMGTAFREMGSYDKALEWYQEAMAYTKPKSAWRAHVLANIAETYLALEAWETALEISGDALTVFKQGQDMSALAHAHYLQARGYFGSKDLRLAEESMSKVLSIIGEQRKALSASSLGRTFGHTRHPYYAFHTRLLLKRYDEEKTQSLARKAFESFERARAEAAYIRTEPRDITNQRKAEIATLEQEIERLEQLRESEGEVNSGGFEERLREQVYSLDELLLEAEVHTMGGVVSQDDIQRELLDPNTLLLAFHLDEPVSRLFLIDQENVEIYDLPGKKRVDQLSRACYGLLSKPGNSGASLQLSALLENLSALVLRPVASRLKGKRLLFVKDGLLHYVPFAALPDPNGLKQPLGLSSELVNLSSASFGVWQQRSLARRSQASGLLAIFADPVFSDRDERFEVPATLGGESTNNPVVHSDGMLDWNSLKRLPGTKAEAGAIIKMAPPELRFDALGFEATRSSLPAIKNYRIAHIATHGFLHPVVTELSGLVLSRWDAQRQPLDGIWRACHVNGIYLPLDLMVLSACDSALGKEVAGEGPWGFSQELQSAGVARVVVSLWKVSDEATTHFMSSFYKAMLKNGASPSEALLDARQALWEIAEYRHPYYWASFELQGVWRDFEKK